MTTRDLMNPGFTHIASQLAERLPNGAVTPEQAVEAWRTELYAAEANASLAALGDRIERSATPGDEVPRWAAAVLRMLGR